LLNEVGLFDAPPKASLTMNVRQVLRGLVPPFERRPTEIASRRAVITRQIARQAPPADRIWASTDLFHTANRAYALYHRFTSVRMDRARTDLMHWTCPLPLKARGPANLYTIRDLVPLRLPYTTLDNKRNFLSLCSTIGREADKVVTVSEASKRDLIEILGIPEDRIFVTYQAVDVPRSLSERPEADVAREIESLFDLPWQGYFLFFGAVEPKKNLQRILAAYLASGVSAPLVVIGGEGWLHEGETRLIYDDLVQAEVFRAGVLRRADRIRRYDYLPYELLVSVIRGARATLFPSLYEGFGLPILESMLLGAPVVASTAGALPEVAGEAALLVDPYDTQAITTAIRALDSDQDLRRELTERGFRQAERFSPAAYQARLMELYSQVS
jgi:glycosyltransferase involved in cell wall biosynthesis